MIILSNIKTLYDGTSATPEAVRHGMDIWIEEGRIHDVRPFNPEKPGGSGFQRVDCTALTVTPGLIDCHGHVMLWGIERDDLDRMNSQAGLLYAEKILYHTLVNGGVTTLRDVGGATHFLKRMVEEGMMIGPRLKIAIGMLSTTGGHADFRGPDRCCGAVSRLWPPGPGRPSSIVDGPWECRKRVRELAACGADLVKICASPGVVSPTDRLEHRDFSAPEIEAICDEAQARGLYVAAHAHSHQGIALAIENGVEDIQHISFLDEDLAEQAYAKGCRVTPTSWISQALQDVKDLSPLIQEKIRQVGEVHSRAVRLAYASGLKLLSGTDPVLPRMHGRNYMELASLIRDGVPPLAAWFGATGLAGEGVGQEDTGKILPGYRADLLICEDDVLEAPERFDQGALREVVKDGIGYRGVVTEFPQRTFAHSVSEALDCSEP